MHAANKRSRWLKGRRMFPPLGSMEKMRGPDAALVASSEKGEPVRDVSDAVLRRLGSRSTFYSRNPNKRFHGGNDPATRRVRQSGVNGVTRLRNASRLDALAATGCGRRVRWIYWDVFGLYLESVCGRRARHGKAAQHRVERRVRARCFDSRRIASAVRAFARQD
jgi:hypothetical protein